MNMKIIIPGDKIADGAVRMENAFVEDSKTYATVLGLLDEQSKAFIPLESVWYPREGDSLIGVVENVRNSVAMVNTNSTFRGLIIGRRGDSESEMNIGEVVSAFVREVKREADQIILILERPRKLFGGKLIFVKPSKISRVIGRQSTMLRQLETGTHCTISVGLNGVVWMKGGDVQLAIRAIDKIREEAHTSGLTERIAKMLASEAIK